MSDWNLSDLFEEMESELKLEGDLLFPKKGEQWVLFMLPPAVYEGKPKLMVKVDSEYQGKPTVQYLVRFIAIAKSAKIDWNQARLVAIPLPKASITSITQAFANEYPLAQQKQGAIFLTKDPKTTLTFSPRPGEIPNDVWTTVEEMTWERALKAFNDFKNRDQPVKEEEMPF